MSTAGGLSRRERQIMDILYQRGKASASDVREAMEAAPGYSAGRGMMRGRGGGRDGAGGQGQAERGETRDGNILQWECGADCGGAVGRFFHAADAGGTGADVGNDRGSQERGKIKW